MNFHFSSTNRSARRSGLKFESSRRFFAKLASRRLQRRMAALTLLVVSSSLSLSVLRADDTWTGASSALWSNAANWTNGLPTASYGTLTFATALNSPSTDDISSMSQNRLLMTVTAATAAGGFTINGTGTISLYDNGGTQAKIENNTGTGAASGVFTLNTSVINFAATSGATYGEINAVTGDVLFGTSNTLNVNGSVVAGIRMFGGGHTTTFNNTVNAGTNYFDTASTSAQTVVVGGAFTSGDFYLMNGSTLNDASTGTNFAAANLRLGGDFATTGNQNLASGATFNMTVATGGQTYAGSINPVSGNTSGALLIQSQNTSGTNTLAGSFFLDSNLKINQSGAGGTLLLGAASSTNTISYQNAGSRTLTLNPSGSAASAITVNEAFTNVVDGSDVLVTTGNANTSTTTINADNSASGSNLLLFNVQSGSLAISAANNLGSPVVSSGYPDKILFGTATSSTTGTLQINGTFAYGSAASGSLLGFSIYKSSGTNVGRINVTGTNAFTMNGALSDFGTGANAGNWEFNNGTGTTSTGTITLNAASTYGGTTTLAGGLLNLGNASAISTGTFIFNGAASFDNTSGSAMTISNALTLSNGSPTFVGTNNLTINGAVTISGGTRTITVSANTLTLNGAIGQDASARTLGKAGAGALTLNGVSNNTGGLTLSGGTLNLNNAAALGTGTFNISAAGVTINNTSGGSLTETNNPAITFGNSFTYGGSNSLNLGTGAVSDSGDRTVTLNSNNTNTLTFGGTFINNSTAAHTLTVNNASGVSGETLILNGVNLAASNTSTVAYVFAGTGNLTINGTIADGTGATVGNGYVYNGGSGGTGVLTLTGANTYTGATRLVGGTVNLNSAGALSGSGVNLAGSAINNTSGAAITESNNAPITISNSFAFGGSNSLNLGTGATSITTDSTITLNGNNTNTLTFGGTLTNTRTNVGVGITVNNGTGVSGETVVFNNGINLNNSSATSALNTNLGGSGNIIVNGVVANGNSFNNTLTKVGTGVVTLTGASTYTGATAVNGGTLLVTGSTSASSAVSVAGAGTTLAGSGTVGGTVTVGNGTTASRLSPGGTTATGNGTAILNTGALTLAAASVYAVDLNSNVAGTGYDQTNVTGTVTLTGSTLSVTTGYTPASSDVFVLINNDGTDAITGTFASTSGVPTGYSLDYTYDSATGSLTGGNDLALVSVPEPATWLAGALSFGLLGRFARNYRRSRQAGAKA